MECRAALAEVPSDFRCATEKYGMAASAGPPSISFREFTVSEFVQGGPTLKKLPYSLTCSGTNALNEARLRGTLT